MYNTSTTFNAFTYSFLIIASPIQPRHTHRDMLRVRDDDIDVDYSYYDINKPVESKKLLAALNKLESIIGRASIEQLVYDLETHGITLVHPRTAYTLAQFQIALEKVLAREGTTLLMDRLERQLKVP